MDQSLILKAAMLTKGGSGPSGQKVDLDHLALTLMVVEKILTLHSFGTASSDLRKTFALFVKREIKKCRIPGVIHFMQGDPIR